MGIRREQAGKGLSDAQGDIFLAAVPGEIEHLGCAKCGKAIHIRAIIGAPQHRVIVRCTACDWSVDRATPQFPAWFVRWPEGHTTTPPSYLGDGTADPPAR